MVGLSAVGVSPNAFDINGPAVGGSREVGKRPVATDDGPDKQQNRRADHHSAEQNVNGEGDGAVQYFLHVPGVRVGGRDRHVEVQEHANDELGNQCDQRRQADTAQVRGAVQPRVPASGSGERGLRVSPDIVTFFLRHRSSHC